MKLNYILLLNAIVSLMNALGAILIPSKILNTYGVDGGESVELMAQYAGIGSIAIGLLAFFATKIEPSDAKRYIVLSLFVSGTIGLIISFSGTVMGTMGASGWSLVFIYLFFTIGYGYFLFLKKRFWITEI